LRHSERPKGVEESQSLDNVDTFVAIPGVGPATDQKLRDAGFRTYADLTHRGQDLDVVVGPRTAYKIRAWLAGRPM